MELHPFGIDVVIIQPGATHSEWGSIARDSLLKFSADGPYREGARSHAKFMDIGHEGSIPAPPSAVAKTIVRAVQAHRPKIRYATGGLAKTMLFLRSILSDRAFDATFRMAERQTVKSSVSR
jgi:NAD(P)-dependent dehydrogenase (short-subunit alcohol dehydrogenase family)